MKKLKHKFPKRKTGFISGNRVVFAALAGAVTGLAITCLLESEKGRSLLGSLGNSVKSMVGNFRLPDSSNVKA